MPKIPSFLDFYPDLKIAIDTQKFINHGKKKVVFTEQNVVPQYITKFEELEKGCLIWIADEKYPIRGNLAKDRVTELTKIKRIIPLFFRFLTGKQEFERNHWWDRLMITIGFIQYKKFLFEWMHWALSDIYFPVEKYSQPVREVYKALLDYPKLREVVCVILEFDTAYRYRFQDILAELSKGNFSKNPLNEIRRLMNILQEREQGDQGGLKKILIYKKYIVGYLMINRKLLNDFKSVVEKLDLNELISSVEDLYWQNAPMWNYNFRGLNNEERKISYLREKNEIKR